MGQIQPHFHMHIGEIGHFFKIGVLPKPHARLGVDSPHKPTGHFQNTPRTPPVRLPLGAAGSQSAL